MIKMDLQMFGGRGGSSGMDSSGGSFMSNQQNMEDYAIATGALDIGSEEETRAFMRTPEGKAALQEFMEGERELGLTEQEMREAIQSTGSNQRQSNQRPSAGELGLNTNDRYMNNRENAVNYALATGALDVGSERETRAFLRTSEGQQALVEFMEGEIELGLTGSQMKREINRVRRRR